MTGERFLTLVHDPDTGRAYILRHGVDAFEGADIPEGTELFEYPTSDSAQRAYEQLLNESRAAGELVDEDSTEDLGDYETDGAEVRDLYSASDEDDLVRDPLISEQETDEEESEP